MFVFSSPKISELLYEAVAYLKKHAIASAQLDARLLLQYVLKQPAEFLVREPNHLCSNKHLQEYEQVLKRRAQHEPVAKIVGVKEFWGMPFKVTKDVLDPRPDSETLIESVREKFPDTNQSYRILDLGVGSGCLLLCLLHDYPQATGVGVDISPDALQVAQHNAHELSLDQRSHFVCSSWGQAITGKFDIIIANPPYIPSQVVPTLTPEVSRFDPILALDGGQDGLDCYLRLAPEAARLLTPRGKLFIEIGQGQDKDVESIFKDFGLSILSWKKDLQGIIRCGVFLKVT